jgi:hypothetical protein
MKFALISLLALLFSCRSVQYYKAAEVATNLEGNSLQIQTLSSKVENDFEQKTTIYNKISAQSKDKDGYVFQDLKWRMTDMQAKKAIFQKTLDEFMDRNTDLQNEVQKKELISENDPVFNKIRNFSYSTEEDSKEMTKQFQDYQKSSNEFLRFVLFARNMI